MGKSLSLVEQIKNALSRPDTCRQAGRVLSKWIGQQKELQAMAFLKNQQIQPIVHNFRCDRYRKGEIDLIGYDQNRQVLIFFEVKYRKNTAHGHPAETITAGQQQRIRRCAEVFLQSHPEYQNHDCRFDVISITGEQTPQWIQNAF